jgi:ATP-dependent DNA ligase
MILNWKEYRRKNLYWKIRQDGDTYYTEHGQVGTDNPQTFFDTPGPKGKENTKAYVNAIDNCAFNVDREIRKKVEAGYLPYIEGEDLLADNFVGEEIYFDQKLPKNFCGCKPQTSIEQSKHEKIFKAGNARYSRKYDGQGHVACKHTWGWEIYTRRMDVATDIFPLQIEALSKLDFEVGTIIQGEMVCITNGKEDFKQISRYCRSDAPVARKLVEDKEVAEPTFLIFDIVFHNGNSLKNTSYDNRRKLYNNIDLNLIKAVQLENVSPENWEHIAKTNGWEGYVVVDGSGSPGEKFYSFDGDAKRPNTSWKLKPIYTEDVVVYAGVKGSGKRLGKVGAVLTKQMHPETKEWFKCGKVGSGFTEEDIDIIGNKLLELNLPLYDDEKKDKNLLDYSGFVVEIEYSERQPGTNKFRFPVFTKIHEDKTPKECFAQRLAGDEE